MSDQDICVITHPLGAAGENATRTLLDILAELGPVSLITAGLPQDSAIRKNREVVELTTKGPGDSIFIAAFRFISNQIKMCQKIWSRSENIIYFFGATSYLLPIIFARLIGKRVIVAPRGDVPLTLELKWKNRMPNFIAQTLSNIVRLLERAGFSVAHLVVTYTPNMAKELGLDPNSKKVYPHGARYVDTAKLQPIIQYDKRDNVIGFVGRLDEEKGIRELAKVAKELPDDITFLFVGDGPLHDWLKSFLNDEIENGKVEMVGWIDHDRIPEVMNRMKLLVMPSRSTEGLPTVILEGMACGTPAFATPVAGVPDVVLDNETGFLMEDENADGACKKIVTILGKDGLGDISNNATELVKNHYDYKAAVQRYKKLLQTVENS